MSDTADDRPIVTGELIKLDYATLRNTKYVNCKLVYTGGRPPDMQGCDITECEFIFENEAMNTMNFMGMLARSGDGELIVHQMLGLRNWEPKKDVGE